MCSKRLLERLWLRLRYLLFETGICLSWFSDMCQLMSTISLSINYHRAGFGRGAGFCWLSFYSASLPSLSTQEQQQQDMTGDQASWQKWWSLLVISVEPKSQKSKKSDPPDPTHVSPKQVQHKSWNTWWEIFRIHFNGGTLVLFQTIFCGDIPLHKPHIGLVYGRYLQFRFLKWPLKIQAMTKLRWVNWFVKCAPYVPYSNHCQHFGIWGIQSSRHRWGFHTRGCKKWIDDHRRVWVYIYMSNFWLPSGKLTWLWTSPF